MYTVTVMEEADGKKKSRLIAVFIKREDAKKFVRGFEVEQAEGVYWVKSPNVVEEPPKKIRRWLFSSQEKAEEFIKNVKIKEEKGNGKTTL